MTKRSFWPALLVIASTFAYVAAQDPEDWETIRSTAESRYELVLLQVERGLFDEAVTTAEGIFKLPFPVDKDEMLFDSAKEISDALIHYDQHQRALTVLNFCLIAVKVPQIHSKLHKEMAYVYKKMGKDDEAMRHFEQAIELSKKKPRS